jgi:hypothetical protein
VLLTHIEALFFICTLINRFCSWHNSNYERTRFRTETAQRSPRKSAQGSSSVAAETNISGTFAPLNVPRPGPTNDLPYAPQPILQGGIVLPLYAPDSTQLNQLASCCGNISDEADLALPGW